MNKTNIGLHKKAHISALAGLMMLGLGLGGPQAQATSESFSHLYGYGDSLLDTGNYFRLSGGLPPSPYVDGRFCNGPIWLEYLAPALGMEFVAADNFAVAGAATGVLNKNDGVAGREYPGLLEQIALFQATCPVTEPERALFVVEGGANDFFLALRDGTSPADLIANGVSNTVVAIQQLRSSGARFILVMNLPDLGLTPFAHSIGMSPQLTQLSGLYNQYLNLALDQLAQAGIPTIRLDAFAALNAMASSPASYGFTNITDCAVYGGVDSDQYLFWDDVHPTTRAHAVLAKDAVEQLINYFSPSKGRGTPDAMANALHGLVNSSQR